MEMVADKITTQQEISMNFSIFQFLSVKIYWTIINIAVKIYYFHLVK